MQFHQPMNPIVEGQKNYLIFGTHQLDRCTTGSVRHGQAAKLLKLFNHNKLMNHSMKITPTRDLLCELTFIPHL